MDPELLNNFYMNYVTHINFQKENRQHFYELLLRRGEVCRLSWSIGWATSIFYSSCLSTTNVFTAYEYSEHAFIAISLIAMLFNCKSVNCNVLQIKSN